MGPPHGRFGALCLDDRAPVRNSGPEVGIPGDAVGAPHRPVPGAGDRTGGRSAATFALLSYGAASAPTARVGSRTFGKRGALGWPRSANAATCRLRASSG